jgi:hypothetical protein
MFEYGVRNPDHLLCSTMAENHTCNKIITGVTKMRDVLGKTLVSLVLEKSSNYEIKFITPLGIIKSDGDVGVVME